MTDTAASVGAKPNSRKPRIFTVIGTSPGRARKSDRLTSVNEWTKANTAPAMMPLLISGNTTCHSVRQREAPRLAAASSTFGGSVCRLIATVRTAKGRQITTWPTSSAVKPM